MKTRQCVIFLGLLFGSLTLLDAENSTPAKPGDLRNAGTVDFTVTCSASVQPDFNRGVALLHSFFYEEARRSSPLPPRRIQVVPWHNGGSR